MLVERLGRQFPHALERRIVQPHAAVRAEHRDRFGQVIERLALHLDQRIVAAVHDEALGDVVIQISDAALGIGRGHHAQRAAVRQVPHMLLRLDRAIGLVQLLLPLPVILLLGQLAIGAQGIEHEAVGRRLVEHGGVEFEQRAERGVVEDQLAVGVEDGDAGGELVEHAAVGLDHARQIGAHRLHLGGVDRHAGAAGAARRVHHVEDAALPRGDRRQSFGMGAVGARAVEIVARGAVEQFEVARHRVGRVVGFDRAGVSRVDEDQAAVVVARPHRSGQRIEQRLQRLDVAGQPVVAAGQIHQLALDAADVAQAQHGAPGHRAPFRLERTAGAAGKRHHEGAAFGAQRVDGILHPLRRRRLQPGAEGEHAFGSRAPHDNGGVAEDFRLVGAGRPGHQHLRLRQQQSLEPVDFRVERHGLVVRRGFMGGGGFARAQQRDGGEYREADEPERQRDCGGLRTAHRRDGADDVVGEVQGCRHPGVSRRAERAEKRCKNHGDEESAPPRTRTQPLVRRPDCLRHSDLPQESERRPPRCSRIAGLYPRGDSCRKSPDREREPDWASSYLFVCA